MRTKTGLSTPRIGNLGKNLGKNIRAVEPTGKYSTEVDHNLEDQFN